MSYSLSLPSLLPSFLPSFLPLPSSPFLSLPSPSFPSLPFPSLPFPSLPFPSLPFPSLPFPSLPFPSLSRHCVFDPKRLSFISRLCRFGGLLHDAVRNVLSGVDLVHLKVLLGDSHSLTHSLAHSLTHALMTMVRVRRVTKLSHNKSACLGPHTVASQAMHEKSRERGPTATVSAWPTTFTGPQ